MVATLQNKVLYEQLIHEACYIRRHVQYVQIKKGTLPAEWEHGWCGDLSTYTSLIGFVRKVTQNAELGPALVDTVRCDPYDDNCSVLSYPPSWLEPLTVEQAKRLNAAFVTCGICGANCKGENLRKKHDFHHDITFRTGTKQSEVYLCEECLKTLVRCEHLKILCRKVQCYPVMLDVATVQGYVHSDVLNEFCDEYNMVMVILDNGTKAVTHHSGTLRVIVKQYGQGTAKHVMKGSLLGSRSRVCRTCSALYLPSDDSPDMCFNCYLRDTPMVNTYSYKPAPVFFVSKERKETNRNKGVQQLYFGLELEVEVPSDDLSVARRCLGPCTDEVYLKHDGTIHHGFEIVSHPKTFAAWKENADFFIACAELEELCQATAYHQGIHIHMSRKAFTEAQIRKLYVFMYQMASLYPTFYSYLFGRPPNRFCQVPALIDRTWTSLLKATYTRYQAINLQCSDTIEIRAFRGSLNDSEILACIETCEAMYRFIKATPAPAIISGKFLNDFQCMILAADDLPALKKKIQTWRTGELFYIAPEECTQPDTEAVCAS